MNSAPLWFGKYRVCIHLPLKNVKTYKNVNILKKVYGLKNLKNYSFGLKT